MNIKIIAFDNLPQDSKDIREEVFVIEQGFEEEFDTIDNRALHLVAYDNLGRSLGTCRVFSEGSEATFYLGRLAVKKDFRSAGIGKELVLAAEEAVRARGGECIKLHSQKRAMNFYKKCGYKEFGEVDFEEGCPHIWMEKHLI